MYEYVYIYMYMYTNIVARMAIRHQQVLTEPTRSQNILELQHTHFRRPASSTVCSFQIFIFSCEFGQFCTCSQTSSWQASQFDCVKKQKLFL
jgi:hypothetical protein